MRKETALNDRMTFYATWLNMAEEHLKTSGERLMFLEAVLRYGFFGQMPEIKGKAGVLFELARQQIDILQKRQNRYRCSKEKRQSSDNGTTIVRQSSDNGTTIVKKEIENKKENIPQHPLLRNKQETKEAFSACASGEEFDDLMPEHLKEDADFRAEWLTWLGYRRKTRRSVSRAAASRQLKLLGDYEPQDAILIIENSITNDWQGLFPAKTKNLKPRRDYTGL